MIIFVLALVVLGPEKLPRVVSEVGRWVGRARAMARQFREQLEEEVQLEEARKAQSAARAAQPPPPAPQPAAAPPPAGSAAVNAPPPPVYGDTFSHAHPTDETGADPTAARPAPAPSVDERRS
ncbi:MAG TPA: Sec-independent protein translocase protein TatB [Steroidobacteraceae bacterium]|nr:Sec-independent protein translocase protein TatB [Steroidobacteraceae bacterium]